MTPTTLTGRSFTPAERTALDEFARAARATLGHELREVRLFGSRARGTGTEESDLDLAVVVTSAGRRRRHEVQDLAFDIGLRHGVVLAPLVIEDRVLDELRARERRLARDIERDGIPL